MPDDFDSLFLTSAIAKAIYKDEAEVNMLVGADRIAETSGKFCNEILICMERTLEPNYW